MGDNLLFYLDSCGERPRTNELVNGVGQRRLLKRIENGKGKLIQKQQRFPIKYE